MAYYHPTKEEIERRTREIEHQFRDAIAKSYAKWEHQEAMARAVNGQYSVREKEIHVERGSYVVPRLEYVPDADWKTAMCIPISLLGILCAVFWILLINQSWWAVAAAASQTLVVPCICCGLEELVTKAKRYKNESQNHS